MVEKSTRIRLSVTMSKRYVDCLDSLVKDGIYLNRGMAINDAIRLLFRLYRIEPFPFDLLDIESIFKAHSRNNTIN